MGPPKRNLPILAQSQRSSIIHMFKLAEQLVSSSSLDFNHTYPSTNTSTQHHRSHNSTPDLWHQKLRRLHFLRRLLRLLRHMGILLRSRNKWKEFGRDGSCV